MAKHRPFFSIIIPCYNDGRYSEGNHLDRLLGSLTQQNLPKNDIEIILSDDHSPVKFDDVTEKYRSKLLIKYVLTDYNFAPGNTREKGVSIATGEWIAFADHDDKYYPDALRRVKEGLIEKDEHVFAFTDFDGVYADDTFKKKYECTMNWCHGKFYNLDNFWKKYNLHFIKDLKTHEDIAICTQVSCTLSALGIDKVTYFPFSSYAWTDNPKSISHSKYTLGTSDDPRYFLEVFFKDYITSTGEIYLKRFENQEIKITFAIKNCLEILCYCYFYTQSFQFYRPNDYLKENLQYAGEYLSKVESTFNLTEDRIYQAVASAGAAMYWRVWEYAKLASGPIMPQQTFRQWLDLIKQ